MAANRINITLGDMQLIQIDMLAELNGMNRSECIANLINTEFGKEEYFGHVDYKEMHARLDERYAMRYEKKRTERVGGSPASE